MKHVLFFLSILSGIAAAQTIDQSHIRDSGQYYYGSGVADNPAEAKSKALDELIGQIAVKVSSSFEQKLSEGGSGDEQEKVEDILKTHKQASLRDVKAVTEPTDDGRIRVFCYLEKSEVEKIFDERRVLIAQMAAKARQYEQEGNAAYALKLYYFGVILMNSLPDVSVQYQGVNYTLELPHLIGNVLQETQFSLKSNSIKENEREITLAVNRNGQPLSRLDFSFWDGNQYVDAQAQNGLATVRLLSSGSALKELKLKIKLAYFEARQEYREVDELWDLVVRPSYSEQNKALALSDQQITPEKLPESGLNLQNTEDIPMLKRISEETARFLAFLKAGKTANIDRDYGSDPFLCDKLRAYMMYNHPRPMDEAPQADVNKTAAGYEVRRLRVLHQYPSLSKQATDYLVLDFDDQGGLQDFNLSIYDNLYQKFVKQAEFGKDWGNRQQIIKFVEKYRTAYMTRDLNMINLMFAEDALIIVGRKIERRELPDGAMKYNKLNGSDPDYEYLRMTKSEFLGRQKRIFDAQQDIFIDYGSFDINRKQNDPNVYGLEMRQSYNSTSYADEGYLFLLIDFTGDDPLIYVRAWQPNEWDEDALVRTANFRIYK